jgi:hypothetical protein
MRPGNLTHPGAYHLAKQGGDLLNKFGKKTVIWHEPGVSDNYIATIFNATSFSHPLTLSQKKFANSERLPNIAPLSNGILAVFSSSQLSFIPF